MMTRNVDKQSKRRRHLGLVAALLAVLIASGFGLKSTLAWLTSQDGLTNTFTPGRVTTEIEEEFPEAEVKKNVKIKNTGNVDAYIRVALEAAWKDGDMIAARPVEVTDYAEDLNLTDWFKAGDYYYYKYIVPPGMLTTNLINTFEILVHPEGLNFELQVLSSGIQADPDEAVESVWPLVEVVGGELAPRAGGGGGTP